MLNEFSLEKTDLSSIENRPGEAIKNEQFAMVLNVRSLYKEFIHVGEPYRLVEGRIMWIKEGAVETEINLDEFHLRKGDILLIAPETIMKLKSCSDDFNVMGVAFKENIPVRRNIILHAGAADWQETTDLARCLWQTASHKPFRSDTVRHLLSAIVSDIQNIDREEREAHPEPRKSRQEQIFSHFKRLVNENCTRERSIPFYAGKLALTPHYLSSVISKVSGRSVMYWINCATVLHAKVMLKDKDFLIYEIAERLNYPSQSAFSSFFKRETGMTPGEYRASE